MTEETETISPASRLFAVLLGIAVPSVVYGRAVFAVIVGLALITLFICRPWREITRDLMLQCQTPLGILILLTYAAWLPSVFNSGFPLRSFEAVTRTLIFVGAASAFCSCLGRDQRLVAITLRAFAVMAAISAAFALLSITVLPELYWALRLKGWLSQPIGTGLKGFSALAVLIVPALLLVACRASTKWRAGLLLVSIAYVALVWESYNRSAIAGFLAIMVTLVLASMARRGSRNSILLAIGSTTALTAGVFIWLRMTRGFMLRLAPEGDRFFPVWLIDHERQTIWSSALKIASDSIWTGIGANTINFSSGANAIIAGTRDLHVIPAHPHNWAVEVISEAGILGFTFLLTTILVSGFMTLRNLRRTGGPGLYLALAVMAGYWGSGLFNFSYWSAWWQLSFFISLVFCYAFANKATESG